MLSWSHLPPLNEKQAAVLTAFINEVLPPVPGNYRIRFNELEFVHDAINRWLHMNFGFHVSPGDLCNLFEWNGYRITRIGYNEDPDPKVQQFPKDFAPYDAYAASKLYVNVHVPTLRMLRRYRTNLPERMKPERIAEQRSFETRLETFVHEHSVAADEGSGIGLL